MFIVPPWAAQTGRLATALAAGIVAVPRNCPNALVTRTVPASTDVNGRTSVALAIAWLVAVSVCVIWTVKKIVLVDGFREYVPTLVILPTPAESTFP
jgi:hypothetical protein